MATTTRWRGALAALTLCTAAATAQVAPENWPAKPITLVVPYPPGGPTDIVARSVAKGLGEMLGQTVIIDNRSGAGGNIGAELVAKSTPDGYTLLLATTAHAINMSLFKDLNYDTSKSFVPLSLLTKGPLVIVTRPGLAANNVQELIALAKASPGKLTFASSGNGQSTHLAAELFNAMAGTRMVHVPYRGSVPAMTDVMGGQTDLMFNTMLSSMPSVHDGKLRALAVTSAARSPAAADIPTVSEAGLPHYEATAWNGLMVPAGTPDAIVQKLSTTLQKVLADQALQQQFAKQGFDTQWMSPADYQQFVTDEVNKWAEVVKTSGATVN